jgi:hypothetical protein
MINVVLFVKVVYMKTTRNSISVLNANKEKHFIIIFIALIALYCASIVIILP